MREAPSRPSRPRATGRSGPSARYLAAAAQLVTMVPPDGTEVAGGVARIRLQDVADWTGRSRSGLYRLWSTQEEFWSDLTLHLVFQNDYGRSEETEPWSAWLPEVGAPYVGHDRGPLEQLRTAMNLVQHLVLADAGIQLRATLLGYPDLPVVREVRERVEERRLQDLGNVLSGVLAGAGGHVRAPFTPYDFAVAVWCLCDGFAILSRLLPRLAEVSIPVDDGNGPRPWSLLAYGMRAAVVDVAAKGARPPTLPIEASLHDQYHELAARWRPGQLEVLQAASARFLEMTAADMAEERGREESIEVLGQLTIAGVARASQVTPRAIYHVWPSISDLRLDLLPVFLRAERSRLHHALSRVEPNAEDPAATLVSAAVRPPAPSRISPYHAHLAFLPDANHPAVRDVYRAELERTVESVADHMARIWPRSTRRSGPELDDDSLAVLVLCLITGAGRLARTHPRAFGGDQLRRSPGTSAIALVVRALVLQRPVDAWPAPLRAAHLQAVGECDRSRG